MLTKVFNKTLMQALALGGVLGILNYLAVEVFTVEETNAYYLVFMNLAFISGFIALAYEKVINKKFLSYLIGGFAALTVLASLSHTAIPELYEIEDIRAFFYVVLGILGLGAVAAGVSEKKLTQKEAPALFNRYAQKVVEVWLVSGILSIVTVVVGALGIGLLEISGYEIPEDLIVFLATVAFSIVPFVALDLTYDFKKPLSKQYDKFGFINLGVKVVNILVYILAVFLGFYVLLLGSSLFRQILDTGNTAPIFLGISAVNTLTLFFLIQDTDFVKKKLWSRVALSAETVIMLLVALYAIGVRIGQHGLTINRILVVYITLSLLLLHIIYLVHRKKAKELQQGIQFGNFVVVAIFVAFALFNFTPFNLQALEDMSQEKIEAMKAAEESGEIKEVIEEQ